MRLFRAAVLSSVIALAIVGCSSNGNGNSDGQADNSGGDNLSDASITVCYGDEGETNSGYGWGEVTVTNSGDDVADYTVTVSFEDSTGNQLDTATASFPALSPGQSGTNRVLGFESIGTSFSCRVASVERS